MSEKETSTMRRVTATNSSNGVYTYTGMGVLA